MSIIRVANGVFVCKHLGSLAPGATGYAPCFMREEDSAPYPLMSNEVTCDMGVAFEHACEQINF